VEWERNHSVNQGLAGLSEKVVWLSPKDDPTMVVGTSVSHTTKDGTFDLIGFEGIACEPNFKCCG
jgi:hypothetical protein